MEYNAFASPTDRSCPASPPETPWPPASSSANAQPKSSKPGTHCDIARQSELEVPHERTRHPVRRARRIATAGRRRAWWFGSPARGIRADLSPERAEEHQAFLRGGRTG